MMLPLPVFPAGLPLLCSHRILSLNQRLFSQQCEAGRSNKLVIIPWTHLTVNLNWNISTRAKLPRFQRGASNLTETCVGQGKTQSLLWTSCLNRWIFYILSQFTIQDLVWGRDKPLFHQEKGDCEQGTGKGQEAKWYSGKVISQQKYIWKSKIPPEQVLPNAPCLHPPGNPSLKTTILKRSPDHQLAGWKMQGATWQGMQPVWRGW